MAVVKWDRTRTTKAVGMNKIRRLVIGDSKTKVTATLDDLPDWLRGAIANGVSATDALDAVRGCVACNCKGKS